MTVTSVLTASERSIIVPPNYISGLTLATVGSNTQFTVAPGLASDSTNVDYVYQVPTLTKNTSAWATGNNAGSLDTGTVANNTWYHVHSIKCPANGAVDVLTSLSPTAPTMPSGFTLFRRVGSMKTTTATTPLWVGFIQLRDEFLWTTPFNDINTTLGTTATLFTMSSPSGVKCWVRMRGSISNASSQFGLLINSPDETSTAAGTPTGNYTDVQDVVGSGQAFGELITRTNTVSQIRAVCSVASSSVIVLTFGWYDARGQT